MNWETSLGFCFLVFVSVVLWGSSQGWFSKKIVIKPNATPAPAKETCDAYKLDIERLKGKIFEQSLELDAKKAKIAELTRGTTDLMNNINMLTTKLQAAEATNARMAAALKTALEDLDARSRKLQECTAHLLAKQITHEKCHMTPETSNLIR